MAKYCCAVFVLAALLALVLWNRNRLLKRPRDGE
jgi:hypothetical protein